MSIQFIFRLDFSLIATSKGVGNVLNTFDIYSILTSIKSAYRKVRVAILFPNGSQKMKQSIRVAISKEENLFKLPSETKAYADFKTKIRTIWYPLFLEECHSTILRALAFEPDIDTKKKHLLRSRRMFRFECEELGDEFKDMERKAETEDWIIQKAKEAN